MCEREIISGTLAAAVQIILLLWLVSVALRTDRCSMLYTDNSLAVSSRTEYYGILLS